MAPRRHCRLAAVLVTLLALSATLSHATRLMLHIRATTTKPTTATSTTTSVCSEPVNLLATSSRAQYADCLTELSVSWSSSKPLPWVLTGDANATEICSQISCQLSVTMFLNLLSSDCTVNSTASSTETPIHIEHKAIQKINDACGTPSLSILTPSSTSNSTAKTTATPVPSATTTAQKEQEESNSPSTLTIVGIVLATTVAVLLFLLGCARDSKDSAGRCFFWAL